MAYLRKINKQLKVNKQLNISEILNVLSKHLCFELFSVRNPSGANCEKENKQMKVNKQLISTKIKNFIDYLCGVQWFDSEGCVHCMRGGTVLTS